MVYVLLNYWGWFLAAYVLGAAVGYLTWSQEPREGYFAGWLRWWGLAFVIGLGVALFKWLPGRPGLYLELALWLFALYIVGCFVGGWLRAMFNPGEPIALGSRSNLVDALPDRRSPVGAHPAPFASPVRRELAAPAAPARTAGVKPVGLPGSPDDADNLTWIRGVGPRNESALHELGVWRFAQIADWSPENADWVSQQIKFPGRIAREDWIGQARLLASGKRTNYANFVASGAIKAGADADEPLSDADIAVVRGDIAAGGYAPVEAKAAASAVASAADVAVTGDRQSVNAATGIATAASSADSSSMSSAGQGDVSATAAASATVDASATAADVAGDGASDAGASSDSTETVGSGSAVAAATSAAHAVGDAGGTAATVSEKDRPDALAAPLSGKADDLKLIKGIGPKNEKICNDLGVYHFAQIADWTPENARWFGSHMKFPGRIEREQWIPQAKLLAYGIDTEHSAAVKSGAFVIDERADEPLSDGEVAQLSILLPANVDEAIAKAAESHRPAALPSPHGAADDLKLLKGIGPKNEKICNDLGVFHFAQIADWTPENAQWMGRHMKFPGRIEREQWIPQAKLLAAGIDTPHSTAVKSGAVQIDESADAPLSDDEAQAFANALPQEMPAVEGEDSHEGRRPLGLADARGGKPDDLKRIKGIGKQNEARLHALGVWHFEQISAWSAGNIKWVGSYLAFPGRITREDWINQAKQLAAGAETEFSKRVAAGKVATSKDDGTLGQGNVADLKKH